jgi:hypothetical protein
MIARAVIAAQSAQPEQRPVARIAVLEAALNEISSAGMSPSPEMSDDGKTAWHASQAWRFIGIAARAIELAPAPVGERCCYHDSDCAVHNMPAYPAGSCDCSLASLPQPAQGPSLQEQLDKAIADREKAYADWRKANADLSKTNAAYADRDKAYADLDKAYADLDKTNAEVARLKQLIEEKNT